MIPRGRMKQAGLLLLLPVLALRGARAVPIPLAGASSPSSSPVDSPSTPPRGNGTNDATMRTGALLKELKVPGTTGGGGGLYSGPFAPLVNQNLANTTFRAATRCGAYETNQMTQVEGGHPVVSFLGIRYSDPLTAANRWMPPPPLACPDGATQAVSKVIQWGALCPQSNGRAGQQDCLSLNVFVPQSLAARLPRSYEGDDARPLLPEEKLLPVVVYIHGGGLMDGSAVGLPLWDVAGADPAGTGGGPVVVVSIHYRLGILGWLALEELAEESLATRGTYTSGNYGLQDQQLALRWIQDHIRAFGGDAARVTVMGQSSGGTSVLALLASPASRGLFHRAVSLSGSPNITVDLAAAQRENRPILARLGCSEADGYATATERLACLRALPTDAVATGIPTAWTIPGMNGLPLSPQGQRYGGMPVIDGHLLPLPVMDALQQGTVDAAVVIGNMGQEVDAWPYNEVEALSSPEWRSFLRRWFRDHGWLNYLGLADGLFHLYKNESDRDPQMAFDSIVSDYSLTCGSVLLGTAAAAAPQRSKPVYVYVNAWAPTVQGAYDPSTNSEAKSWMPRYEKIVGFGIVGIAAIIGLAAACGKQRRSRDARHSPDGSPASSVLSPTLVNTPGASHNNHNNNNPGLFSPPPAPPGSAKSLRSLLTPRFSGQSRPRGGVLAGWLLLAAGLLGVILAVGMASTDLLRPRRSIRYASHTWDLLAWMRIYDRSSNSNAAGTGNEGLSRLLRDAFYQLAAEGEIDPAATGWRPIDPLTATPMSSLANATVIKELETMAARDVPSSPASHPFPRPAVFVLRDPAQWPYLPSETIDGYKADTCGFLYRHGIDQRFWWCN